MTDIYIEKLDNGWIVDTSGIRGKTYCKTVDDVMQYLIEVYGDDR